MRADPEFAAEDPDQLGLVDVQGIGRIPEVIFAQSRSAMSARRFSASKSSPGRSSTWCSWWM
jgi:hypothetical protein